MSTYLNTNLPLRTRYEHQYARILHPFSKWKYSLSTFSPNLQSRRRSLHCIIIILYLAPLFLQVQRDRICGAIRDRLDGDHWVHAGGRRKYAAIANEEPLCFPHLPAGIHGRGCGHGAHATTSQLVRGRHLNRRVFCASPLHSRQVSFHLFLRRT